MKAPACGFSAVSGYLAQIHTHSGGTALFRTPGGSGYPRGHKVRSAGHPLRAFLHCTEEALAAAVEAETPSWIPMTTPDFLFSCSGCSLHKDIWWRGTWGCRASCLEEGASFSNTHRMSTWAGSSPCSLSPWAARGSGPHKGSRAGPGGRDPQKLRLHSLLAASGQGECSHFKERKAMLCFALGTRGESWVGSTGEAARQTGWGWAACWLSPGGTAGRLSF